MPRFGRKRMKPSVITLADEARDQRQWERAAGYYRVALQRTPQNPPIWVQYGHVLKELGHWGEAERAYRRAIAYDLHATDAYLHLGHVLKVQGKTEEARAAYLRAAVLDPTLDGASVELRQLGWSDAHLSELQVISPSATSNLPVRNPEIQSPKTTVNSHTHEEEFEHPPPRTRSVRAGAVASRCRKLSL